MSSESNRVIVRVAVSAGQRVGLPCTRELHISAGPQAPCWVAAVAALSLVSASDRNRRGSSVGDMTKASWEHSCDTFQPSAVGQKLETPETDVLGTMLSGIARSSSVVEVESEAN
jgi:hypothetical protein